jgi:hypothetical protein
MDRRHTGADADSRSNIYGDTGNRDLEGRLEARRLRRVGRRQQERTAEE